MPNKFIMHNADIIQYHLSFQEASSYVYRHIKGGLSLSQLTIRDVDFYEGEFFTILPSAVDLHRLFLFSEGGIINPVQPSNDTDQNKQIVWTMDSECSLFIQQFLQADSSHCALVEDACAELQSPRSLSSQVKTLSYKDEVYYLLTKEVEIEDIYKTIRVASQKWHSLCLLTKYPADREDFVTTKSLEKWCEHVCFIIVSAYDNESCIIWENKGSSSLCCNDIHWWELKRKEKKPPFYERSLFKAKHIDYQNGEGFRARLFSGDTWEELK